MRLKEVTIKNNNYKNLDESFSFKDNSGYIALIGLNGSGKSNLLEAISLLFSKVMGITDNVPFSEYRLIYDIDGQEIDITQDQAIAADALPSSVIACYSGEDSRLWESGFKEYYVKFFNEAIGGGEYKPKILYINKYCWKIAFISLLLSENEHVKNFITDTLHIDANSVRIVFKTKTMENLQSNDASDWYQRVVDEYQNKEISIDDLKDVYLDCKKYQNLTDDQVVFYYLYVLFMPDRQKTLGLTADKIIESITITFNGYSFDDLSEGEKKLILIECMTKVLGDENTLVLLDEPDAHTHIAMKKTLLKLISEFEGQTVMTTHSPMFLNKRWDGYYENNLYYMRGGRLENKDHLINLANLTDNEIDYFEGTFILSAKKILVVEGKYDDLYLKKAISVFAKRDTKYNKLNEIAILSANSASAAEVIYNQILSHSIAKIEKLVFLFDYDDGGWKDGWKKIDAIPSRGTKIVPMFYQDIYPSANYPTSDTDVSAANRNKKEITPANSYMIEDLFSESAYATVITPVISARKHKDFRCIPYKNGGTVEKIKKYIENNYNTFADTDYDGFKAVLDELMNVFDLN